MPSNPIDSIRVHLSISEKSFIFCYNNASLLFNCAFRRNLRIDSESPVDQCKWTAEKGTYAIFFHVRNERHLRWRHRCYRRRATRRCRNHDEISRSHHDRRDEIALVYSRRRDVSAMSREKYLIIRSPVLLFLSLAFTRERSRYHLHSFLTESLSSEIKLISSPKEKSKENYNHGTKIEKCTKSRWITFLRGLILSCFLIERKRLRIFMNRAYLIFWKFFVISSQIGHPNHFLTD